MYNNAFKAFGLVLLFVSSVAFAQDEAPNTNVNKFRQLKTELATPNVYRTASGAPGHEYWQQKADYNMDIVLDDAKQTITGSETITYSNNSPDVLEYLWLQLDQNVRAKDSDSYKVASNSIGDSVSFWSLDRMMRDFDGGFKIESVTDLNGNALNTTTNKTMMRIDLDRPLRSGESFSFKVDWWYNINNRMKIGGRSGFEYFEEDDNYLYTIAQFFPRMCVYNDVEGWQNKQFLGRGEFTLPFGDYTVSIEVPSDHIVAATGELENESRVLSTDQLSRLRKAYDADAPVIIATQSEAEDREKVKSGDTKKWVFKAKNVRDFGFATSRKLIWDAQGVKIGDRTVMAMSYYPKEGNPLWEQYSTRAVVQTLKTYSRHTVDYTYPVAISVHSKSIGMEYPMICFNGGRPEKDGTYSERTKYGMISVIIHEVGHNFFPMIINSDERQWTWMDEGLNTFCQYLTEQEWDVDYPSRRGSARKIVNYMKGDKSRISPIMTNSESVHQFGNNAYGKPATALNILRETIMGRELFDHAFKTYSERWAFKHPTPADFFRTMEDASAVDLDWFWRGWFFTNDHVDISLNDVQWFQIDTRDPEVEKPFASNKKAGEHIDISYERNAPNAENTVVGSDPVARDFYNSYDKFAVTEEDKAAQEKYLARLDDEQKEKIHGGQNFYQLKLSNVGGLVMPVILEWVYADGTSEIERIPAEIWLRSDEVTKVFVKEKEVVGVNLDPYQETADVDMNNNNWPPQMPPSRFKVYKSKNWKRSNPMQRSEKANSGAEKKVEGN